MDIKSTLKESIDSIWEKYSDYSKIPPLAVSSVPDDAIGYFGLMVPPFSVKQCHFERKIANNKWKIIRNRLEWYKSLMCALILKRSTLMRTEMV